MNLERYEIIREESSPDFVFSFVSEGPKGCVTKAVVFTEINLHNLFNLGFGDADAATKEIDYLSRTNNGDTLLILSTVAAIVISFTEEYPEAMIYAAGSTPSRTRLYQMGISIHLEELRAMFEVYGLKDNDWETFARGVNYDAFYVVRSA